MARLDRLATVKEVAQLGAVIGREFSYEVLSAVSSLDETTLQRELGQLVEAELLYPRGILPQATYIFKHALIQEAAYQSLLKSKRQQYHQRIAQVLEERFPETVETQPELLAHHYTEAGLILQAIPYWQKAGQSAEKRWANLEAISHLNKGLELLKTLPESAECHQQELTMQIALGRSLMAARGYGASEVEIAYVRARELCQKLGDTTQIFPVLFGLCSYYRLQGYIWKSCELAKEFVHLAQLKGDPTLLLVSHRVLGTDLLTLGEFASARKHLEYAISLYEPQQHRSLASIYSMDPKMAGLSMLSWTLWGLGYPDSALERSRKAVTLAKELSHPLTLAYVLGAAAIVHTLCREEYEAQELAEAAIEFSTEKGIPLFLAVGIILRGWALSEQGQVEEGIAQMLQGLDVWRATGSEMVKPYFLSLLSKMHGKVGQIEKGLSVLNEALAMVEKNGDCIWEAELYRLKGELLLMQAEGRREIQRTGEPPVPPNEEAEACFHKALEVARRQQAKSWELRTVVRLGASVAEAGQKGGSPTDAG